MIYDSLLPQTGTRPFQMGGEPVEPVEKKLLLNQVFWDRTGF